MPQNRMTSAAAKLSPLWPASLPGRLSLACGLAGFLLYLARLTPGVGWYDSAEFVGVATTFGIAHPTGYPLYSLLGRLAALLFSPISDPAIRTNLLSALAAGGTLAVLTLVTWRLLGLLRLGPLPRIVRALAALLPSTVLGSMALFMEQAVVAEVYTLHTLLVALLLLMALEGVLLAERPVPVLEADELRGLEAGIWGPAGWRIHLLLAYTAGLGLGNHFTLLLYFPALAVLLWWAVHPETRQPEVVRARSSALALTRLLLPLFIAGLLGFSLYLLLPLRASLQPPFNWGEADSLRDFLRLVTAAEARARPVQFYPVTVLGIWGRIAQGTSWPVMVLALCGWLWAGLRRRRLAVVAVVYLAFPLLFLLWGFDILEDALLPVHLWVVLGVGTFVALLGGWLVSVAGPAVGGRIAIAAALLVLLLGPGVRVAMNWGEVSAVGEGGPSTFTEAVVASVAGEPNPAGEVRGWVFTEENGTAFLLWYEERISGRHPQLYGIYTLLAREEWYRDELRRRVPSLAVPTLDRTYERLPHEAASLALLRANTGQGVQLFLSPIILPPEQAYGVLVPQGVLVRMEPPGYEPTDEDFSRHMALMREYAPAARPGEMPHLDGQTRDIWSWRHKILGEAWARLGALHAAELEYQAGIRVNPERVEPRATLGNFLAVLGDFEGAEAAYRGALELEPRDRALRFELARVLRLQGAFAEADSVLPTGQIAGVPLLEYLLVRAGIHLGLGRSAQARTDLEEAARLAPQSGEVQNDLGVIFLQEGDFEAARQAFLKAIELQPELAEALANLGMLALQDGRLTEAELNLTRAIEAGASSPQLGYSLGIVRMNLQDLEGAQEALRRNLSAWPEHADTYLALGMVLERRGLTQEAVAIYEAGRMAVPDDPRFASQLRRLWNRPPQ